MIASPAADLCLHGSLRKYRSIRASVVAEAILGLAGIAPTGASCTNTTRSCAPRR
jgi:hypothetical protein